MPHTNYTLKELTAMLKEKTVATSLHRGAGRVIRATIEVSEHGARIAREAEFASKWDPNTGEVSETVLDTVYSVL